MRRVHDRVCGLDVHKKSVTACAEWIEEGEVKLVKKRFGTTVSAVDALAVWLAELGVDHVVMESTGVYWKPVYYGLEERFGGDGLMLANAFHVKNVPGRKTDMSDAEWLADLAAHGMIRGSFVPPPEVRALRELTRYRKQLTKTRVQQIQRLEKTFQDAGIKFTSVASQVWLKSSEAMVEALIGGERDALVLAGFAKGSLVNKRDELGEAMANRWQDHHSLAARSLVDHIRWIDSVVKELSADIDQRCEPWRREIELLKSVPGVGALVAQAIIAETGGDMSRFENANRLASWAGLAPGNNESAGVTKPSRTRFGNSTIKTIMIEAAQAGIRKDGFLKARYWRIARRRGPNKAVVASARSMMVAIWHMLSNNEPWADLGADFHTKHRDPTIQANRHVAALNKLGFNVEITETAA